MGQQFRLYTPSHLHVLTPKFRVSYRPCNSSCSCRCTVPSVGSMRSQRISPLLFESFLTMDRVKAGRDLQPVQRALFVLSATPVCAISYGLTGPFSLYTDYSQCLPGTATTSGSSSTGASSTSTAPPASSGTCANRTKFKFFGVNESGAEFGTGIWPGPLEYFYALWYSQILHRAVPEGLYLPCAKVGKYI
jgi:hypothetical protein